MFKPEDFKPQEALKFVGRVSLIGKTPAELSCEINSLTKKGIKSGAHSEQDIRLTTMGNEVIIHVAAPETPHQIHYRLTWRFKHERKNFKDGIEHEQEVIKIYERSIKAVDENQKQADEWLEAQGQIIP